MCVQLATRFQNYYIICSGSGVVREANKRYNTTGHAYEMTLNGQSVVRFDARERRLQLGGLFSRLRHATIAISRHRQLS